MPKRTCTLPDCERKHCAKGLCRFHYQRVYATGSTELIPREKPKRACSVDGCGQPHAARGYCGKHYQRSINRGWTEDTPKRGTTFDCSIEGCEKPHLARGWCVTHYNRWKRTGNPVLPPRTAPNRELPCTIDGCERNRHRGPHCELHARRIDKGTDLLAPERTPHVGCDEPGCERPHVSLGLCGLHYGRLYSEANREKVREKNRARYLSVPEEERRRLRAEHYQANRERIRARAQERFREVYPLDPAKWRAAKSRRKMLLGIKMTTEDRHISEEYRRAIAKDACLYCAAPGEHTDHFFPLAKGGTDHWHNLVRACAFCNNSKNAHCGTWFMLRRGADATSGNLPAVA